MSCELFFTTRGLGFIANLNVYSSGSREYRTTSCYEFRRTVPKSWSPATLDRWLTFKPLGELRYLYKNLQPILMNRFRFLRNFGKDLSIMPLYSLVKLTTTTVKSRSSLGFLNREGRT